MGIPDASHEEYGAGRGTPVITLLSCSLEGRTISLALPAGSLLARLHGSVATTERTTCDYGLAPGFEHLASSGGMAVAASDATGEVRAVDRPGHPFFLGTLYQPQLSSEPGRPHPIFSAFLAAAA